MYLDWVRAASLGGDYVSKNVYTKLDVVLK
jgi:hypothetical protein